MAVMGAHCAGGGTDQLVKALRPFLNKVAERHQPSVEVALDQRVDDLCFELAAAQRRSWLPETRGEIVDRHMSALAAELQPGRRSLDDLIEAICGSAEEERTGSYIYCDNLEKILRHHIRALAPRVSESAIYAVISDHYHPDKSWNSGRPEHLEDLMREHFAIEPDPARVSDETIQEISEHYFNGPRDDFGQTFTPFAFEYVLRHHLQPKPKPQEPQVRERTPGERLRDLEGHESATNGCLVDLDRRLTALEGAKRIKQLWEYEDFEGSA